jgi:KaiC/GvpD/RAD55 family RecA-like ATPase
MVLKRIKTGIFGLDELIEGGFPEGRSVLLTGGCGTGKTIFSMQFIFKGALEMHEPGIYVTLDEWPDLIREDIMRFGWDIKKLEEENMVKIIDASVGKIGLPSDEEYSVSATGFDMDKLLLEIMRVAKQIGAKRVVIDSVPALAFNFKDENEVRAAILKLSYLLGKLGTTSILVSEVSEGDNKFGKYGVEEFVVDGVVILHYMGIGTQSNRTLHIRKMRATKHSEDLHALSINSAKGISVSKIDTD